jgi:hypothetical protein
VNPETAKRIRAEADAYASEIVEGARDERLAAVTRELLVRAFLRGADAGYTAAKAEERE